ncbi:TPA: fructose-6-phosphate aldolase [Candidatus Woesearchaeota archaeon]|nr:fructose-6-phosphate aldolase [Candidatus Woesearchaeota archaeon]
MYIYIDTGNIDEIKKAAATGLINGVTTNPTLIAKEGKDFPTVIKSIVKILKDAGIRDDFTVSAEVNSTTAPEMIKEGLGYAKWDKHVIVKLPMTTEGLVAAQEFARRGIRTNVTLCFSPNQALLAAKANAFIISPFVGRIDDTGGDGMALIKEIKQIYANYGYKTKVLVASVRSPSHVREAALAGADIATIPYKVFEQLIGHPLTDKGLAQFAKDYADYKTKITGVKPTK